MFYFCVEESFCFGAQLQAAVRLAETIGQHCNRLKQIGQHCGFSPALKLFRLMADNHCEGLELLIKNQPAA
jgi:hypothetical protein